MYSASSTIKTRAAPSNGRKFASRSSSRIGLTRMMWLYGLTIATSACSLQIIRSLLSSALENGGKVECEMRLHDEHSSQASTPTRLRQLSALANSSAKSFLPMPASPVNKSEPGTRPPVSNCRKPCFTSSFPMRVENMIGKSKGQRAKSNCALSPLRLAPCSPKTASQSASLLHESAELTRVRQSGGPDQDSFWQCRDKPRGHAYEIPDAPGPVDRCASLCFFAASARLTQARTNQTTTSSRASVLRSRVARSR